MPSQTKCQAIFLVILLLTFLTSVYPSTAVTTPLQVSDPKDDFITVAGLRAKQPFLDIKNMTVEYDRSTDAVQVTVGMYAPLPQNGPDDPDDKVSFYFYRCNFQTGENSTLDGASVVLEKNGNWTTAYLSCVIRGNTLEGSASPVKYWARGDEIAFTIPSYITSWGRRPQRLSITTEVGYEGYQSNGDVDSVYYDRAPQEDALTFEIPPAPTSYLPLLLLAVIIAPTTVLIIRTISRRTRSQRRKR